MARASVSFSTPMPKTKGSGDANQSWNSDHATATAVSAVAAMPIGFRPPVSASATSASRSGDDLETAWASLMRHILMAGGINERGGLRRPEYQIYLIQPFSL